MRRLAPNLEHLPVPLEHGLGQGLVLIYAALSCPFLVAFEGCGRIGLGAWEERLWEAGCLSASNSDEGRAPQEGLCADNAARPGPPGPARARPKSPGALRVRSQRPGRPGVHCAGQLCGSPSGQSVTPGYEAGRRLWIRSASSFYCQLPGTRPHEWKAAL